MSEHEYTPEEFARLIALPDDHPDRVAAAGSPRFEASRRMLAEFERPSDTLLTDSERESARAELTRRLTGTGALPPPRASGAAPTRHPRSSPGLFDWLRAPAGRAAFAFACAVIVAGVGWWASRSRGPVETTRSVTEAGAFEIASHREGDALVLEWRAVEGADAYRITFLGADLAEIAHLDAPNGTSFPLRASDLPPGVAAGASLSIELSALREGAVLATTPARTVLLP